MHFSFLRLLVVIYVFFHANSAAAHALLLMEGNTPPRSDSDGLKTGPCGNVPRTDKPAIFPAGQQIEIEWKETVEHSGYYTIKLSTQDDDFENYGIVLQARYDDTQNDRSNLPHFYATEINLPNTPCRECTLQLVQVMGQMETANNKYFSCADVVLYDANDTDAPNEVGDLSSQEIDTGIRLAWINPSDDFYKSLVFRSSTPISDLPIDRTGYTAGDTLGSATVVYNGTDSSTVAVDIESDSYYYFKVFTYDDSYNYSSGLEVFIQTAVNTDEGDGSASSDSGETDTMSQQQSSSSGGGLYWMVYLMVSVAMFRRYKRC